MKSTWNFALPIALIMTTLSLSAQSKIVGIAARGPADSAYSGGMVWECRLDGSAFKSLAAFDSGDASGYQPVSLVKGIDHRFYGSLLKGGPSGLGLTYAINQDGSDFHKIYDLALSNLMEGSDGYLYGRYKETIIRLKKDGSEHWGIGLGHDGTNSLVEATDGKLYFGDKESPQPKVYGVNKDGTGTSTLTLPITITSTSWAIYAWTIFPLSNNRLFVSLDYFDYNGPMGHTHTYVFNTDGQVLASGAISFYGLGSRMLGSDEYLYNAWEKLFTQNLTSTALSVQGCSAAPSYYYQVRLEDSAHALWGSTYGGATGQWQIFTWNLADSICAIVRPWDLSMGEDGIPQFLTDDLSSLSVNRPAGNTILFPNPNTGAFTVEFPVPAGSGQTLRILDPTGRLVLARPAEAGSARQALRAEELPAGLYFLEVVADGRVLAVEKFVKQ